MALCLMLSTTYYAQNYAGIKPWAYYDTVITYVMPAICTSAHDKHVQLVTMDLYSFLFYINENYHDLVKAIIQRLQNLQIPGLYYIVWNRL